MQCPKCGKTGFVAISGKRFCSNCGTTITAGGPAPTSMTEISSATQTLDLRANPGAAPGTTAKPLPAAQFHGRQVTGAALRDLRPMPAPSAVIPPQPSPTTQPEPMAAVPVPGTTVAPPAPPTAPATPAPTPSAPMPALVTPIPLPAARTAPPPAPPSAPASVSAPAASSTPVPGATTIPRSPLIQKLPPHPALRQAEPNPMPNAVKSQVEVLASTPPAAQPEPKSNDLQQALKAAKQSNALPNLTKMVAAIAAIGVMSGLIWLQNAPKLAFHNAAAKAGIDASLPTYMPSSFKQSGPANIASGTISINFTSASSETPLSIVQRRTNWDSNSLRENYVIRQSSNFLAVEGQGLVIFLDDDQANWVNHGIWYQLAGTSKLGREQVLKIAYGL